MINLLYSAGLGLLMYYSQILLLWKDVHQVLEHQGFVHKCHACIEVRKTPVISKNEVF